MIRRLLKIAFLASAASIYGTASEAFSLPAGLESGSTFRLVFISAGTTTSMSNDIEDYNQFVADQAALSTELSALGAAWAAIGSTSSVDAKSNTQTDPSSSSSIPIYNLFGELVADNYANLWDGSLDNQIDANQYGNQTSTVVWTGTATDGTGRDSRQLGAIGYRVGFGYSYATNSNWIAVNDWSGALNGFSVYGISNTLTVQTVPLPATGWLFISALIGLGYMGGSRGLS